MYLFKVFCFILHLEHLTSERNTQSQYILLGRREEMSITYTCTIYVIHIQSLAHICSCAKFLCVLHLGQGNPKHKYCVGRELIEGSLQVKGLCVVVHKKLNMSRQYTLGAQKANHSPGLQQRKCDQHLEGGDSSLHSTF